MSEITFSQKEVSHISKLENGTKFPPWKFQLFLAFEQHILKDIVLASSNWDRVDNGARGYIVSTMEERWVA